MSKQNYISLSEYLNVIIAKMRSCELLYKGNPYTYNSIMNWVKFANCWNKFVTVYTKEDLLIKDISIETYYQFNNWCDTLSYKESTKFMYCSIFKAALNYSFCDGVSQNRVYTHRNFKTHYYTETTFHRYLTRDEIDSLIKLQLPKGGTLEKVRDIFLIGCFTGQRFSDYSLISEKDIVNITLYGRSYEIIRRRQRKTGTEVLIPIFNKELINILHRWGGKLPSVCLSTLNSKIKDVCKLANIKQSSQISSHTARRSCITNLYLEGKLNTIQIKSISGHKTDSSFNRYLCLSQEEKVVSIIEALNL